LDKRGEVGGTWNFKCNFYGESRNESYSRVKAHLLQVKGQGIAICKKVTRQDTIEMTRAKEEFERKKELRPKMFLYHVNLNLNRNLISPLKN